MQRRLILEKQSSCNTAGNRVIYSTDTLCCEELKRGEAEVTRVNDGGCTGERF